MVNHDFYQNFFQLTGYEPYPWQVALYERLLKDQIPEAMALLFPSLKKDGPIDGGAGLVPAP